MDLSGTKALENQPTTGRIVQERGGVLSSCTSWGAGDVGVPGFLSEVSALKSRPTAPPGQGREQPGSEDKVESRDLGRAAELGVGWRWEALGPCALCREVLSHKS